MLTVRLYNPDGNIEELAIYDVVGYLFSLKEKDYVKSEDIEKLKFINHTLKLSLNLFNKIINKR